MRTGSINWQSLSFVISSAPFMEVSERELVPGFTRLVSVVFFFQRLATFVDKVQEGANPPTSPSSNRQSSSW